MGALNKYGSSAGSTSEITLIASTLVPSGNEAQITEFGCDVSNGAADSIVILQRSNDNFQTDTVTLDRIQLPAGATALKTYDSPIVVHGGEWFRVRFSQGTGATIGAYVGGQTTGNTIQD